MLSVGEVIDVNSAIPDQVGWGSPESSPRGAWSLDRGSRGVYSV